MGRADVADPFEFNLQRLSGPVQPDPSGSRRDAQRHSHLRNGPALQVDGFDELALLLFQQGQHVSARRSRNDRNRARGPISSATTGSFAGLELELWGAWSITTSVAVVDVEFDRGQLSKQRVS